MRKLKLYVFILAISAFILTSCKKDMPVVEAVDHYAVMTQYMTDNSLDLSDLLSGWVIPAASVVDLADDFSVPDYYVFDLRSAESFAAGHINGATNITLAGVVSAAAGKTDKPILVVCYTGQTAGHAVMALRLSGFADAKVLKWGMAGWNPEFIGPWDSNSGHENGNVALGNSNWVTTTSPALATFAKPAWETSATDGAAILTERVTAMLSGGFKGVSSDDVLATPANYQIMNFWAEADYLAYGHFEGAHQIKPINLAVAQNFDTSKESLVYCYTGQTSSMAVAWLNVIGVNAKSIKFGVNRLNYDGLSADSKPTYHGAEDYGYKTGAGETVVDHYNILSTYMKANDLDLVNMITDWIKPASVLAADLTAYNIFDIRSASSFATGHIEGAINVALTDVVTTAANYTNKPIIVACYTGQTAGHAVVALRLSGHTNAVVLKWGMAGWREDLSSSWVSNTGDLGVGHPNWVTTASPATSTFAAPSWTSTANDGAGILAERVDAMLAGGLVGVPTTTILNNPALYQIFNFWPETDYLTDGHFAGAYQYQNINLSDNGVSAINPETESVVYCYTGQTSSMITAWLNVLGYDVLSGKFGANGVIHSGMSGHKWAPITTDLPVVN